MFKPAFDPNAYSPDPEKLEIVEQDGRLVTIETNDTIIKGQIFRFLPQGIGVALDDGKRVPVRLKSSVDQTLQSVYRQNVTPYSNVPRPLSAWSAKNLGELYAECALFNDVPAGSLGWTLTYQSFDEDEEDESPILQGNDASSRGICQYNGSAEWKEGIYTIYVSFYDLDSMIPVKLKSRDWSLNSPQKILGCGEGCQQPTISFL
jgi:hypothetical protein